MTKELIESVLKTEAYSSAETSAKELLNENWITVLNDPLWYLKIKEDLESLIYQVDLSTPRLKWLRKQLFHTVQESLKNNIIPLTGSDEAFNFDNEREPINTIVIHHTEGRPQVDLDELNTQGFLLQYTQDFLKDRPILGQSIIDKPIGSGHYRDGRQVFYAYHWIIKPNGEAVRLLDDNNIGWHAGNWDVNKKSIGVALAGNFDNNSPPESQLEGLVKLIRDEYKFIEPQRILGHYEINSRKFCPGLTFANSWREKVIGKL